MGAKQKFTAAQVANAVTESKGILAQAARLLGCDRQTVVNYINRYPSVKVAFEEANETTIDFVESQLLAQIRAGNPTSTIFFLKTKARHRGYTERIQQDITINVGELSDDELRAIVES